MIIINNLLNLKITIMADSFNKKERAKKKRKKQQEKAERRKQKKLEGSKPEEYVYVDENGIAFRLRQ